MPGKTILFVIILIFFGGAALVSGASLLTPGTREMIPPAYAIGAFITSTLIIGVSGYYFLE